MKFNRILAIILTCLMVLGAMVIGLQGKPVNRDDSLYLTDKAGVISPAVESQFVQMQKNAAPRLSVAIVQSTLTNTIPLWKSQMVLALGMEHSVQATKAQREVTEMTNQLLKKNAEKLKMATIETAKESERGIVDIETLKNTNKMLVETLDEVVKIQNDGRQKRREAEQELGRIEGELKQKLLDIRQ